MLAGELARTLRRLATCGDELIKITPRDAIEIAEALERAERVVA